MKAVIIMGNPVEGLSFYGPFDDRASAEEWAGGFCTDDWWSADLLAPEDDEVQQ